MREVEIEGELYEVEEEDYQRFLDDQRQAQEDALVKAIVQAIAGANNEVAKALDDGNQSLITAVESLAAKIKTLAVPPITVPPIEMPEVELVMPPQKLIKRAKLADVKRNSRDLIMSCTIEFEY